MKISPKEFRDHMDGMLEKGQHKQARFWVENGTLVYTNYEEVMDLYDEEYREQVEEKS